MTATGAAPLHRTTGAGPGIVLMLAAWGMFSLLDTSAKWLVLAGIPALQVVFMRYAMQFGITLALGLRPATAVPLSRGDRALLLLRAAILVSTTISNFVALRYLPLTLASAIMFSSPIFTSALSGPLLGERVGPWRWGAIFAGFVGVLVVLRPFGEPVHWAAFLILYNALGMAIFSILTRKLSGRVPAQVMQTYLGAFGTLVLLPFAVWLWTNPETLVGWALLFFIGTAGWAGHEMFARAHAHAEASLLMPYAYSYILYVTVTGYVVFGDLPARSTLLGAAIIIASGVLIWWRERRRPKGTTT